MKPRERLLAALDRRQPDQVPIDIGGTSVSTLIGLAYERLKAELAFGSEAYNMKRKSRSAILDEAIALRLHTDTRPLNPGNPDGWSDIFSPVCARIGANIQEDVPPENILALANVAYELGAYRISLIAGRR